MITVENLGSLFTIDDCVVTRFRFTKKLLIPPSSFLIPLTTTKHSSAPSILARHTVRMSRCPRSIP